MTEVWFDKHPLLADFVLLTLPSLGIFLMWMIIGIDIKNAIIQATLTGGIVFVLIIYLNRKYDNNIFRFIDI